MKNKTIWSNRFKNKTSQSFQKIGSSIHIDKRLYEQDIAASIVHTQMLVKQKIIKSEDGNKIINGLKKIKVQIDKGNFEFKEKFEDIHLNIEIPMIVSIFGGSFMVPTIHGKHVIHVLINNNNLCHQYQNQLLHEL